jgi:hypothetical protein
MLSVSIFNVCRPDILLLEYNGISSSLCELFFSLFGLTLIEFVARIQAMKTENNLLQSNTRDADRTKWKFPVHTTPIKGFQLRKS